MDNLKTGTPRQSKAPIPEHYKQIAQKKTFKKLKDDIVGQSSQVDLEDQLNQQELVLTSEFAPPDHPPESWAEIMDNETEKSESSESGSATSEEPSLLPPNRVVDFEDPYRKVVQDPKLLTMSPTAGIKRILDASSASNQPQIKEFWLTHTDFVSQLIQDKAMGVLKLIVTYASQGLNDVEVFITGLITGIQYSKSAETQLAVESIHGILDSMKVIYKDTLSEKRDHQKQTEQFASQVSNSSETLASTVRATEEMFLKLMSVETRPPPPASVFSRPVSSPDSGDLTPSTSTGIRHRDGLEKILLDEGTYSCSFMTAQIHTGTLASLDVKDPAFNQLRVFVGRQIILAAGILNKDLKMLYSHVIEHPDWMDGLVTRPSNEEKNKLFESLEYIPEREYQWERVD